jgi:NitT/TauT family transport system ATP-binding protein
VSENSRDMIKIENLCVSFNTGTIQTNAIQNLNLTIQRNEFVSVIGPSGSGKTTLLRVIADLQKPTSGKITIFGMSPQKARQANQLSVVFQEPALLAWRNAISNISLPLELKGVSQDLCIHKSNEMLELVGLNGFGKHLPQQLSGGMRQRVAIARALSIDPPLLLMDEPFAALDQITRHRMNFELLRICNIARPTVIFITHNIREAILLSDKVVVLSTQPGRVHEIMNIDLPYPRDMNTMKSDRFNELHMHGEKSLEETIQDAKEI